MPERFQFGHKMQRKSWDSSEIDQEAEDKKVRFVLLGLIAFMIIMALFMWWIKQSLHR
jgi:hypothetical protein